ncbi:transposase [Cucumis melo var. makuwa]|uniref:Transposase n=1 Tax=Cucumis melo var. makuwa TaxID=1194695 RepID=A0A5A7VAX7_CUCMM|nr:transposase [Cucumis melo var. makuwa]
MVVYEKKTFDVDNVNIRSRATGINTYLAPVIDDLKILWEEGVQFLMRIKKNISLCEPSYCGLSMISLHTVIYVGVVSKVLRLVQYVEKRLLQSDYNMEKNVYMGHRKYLPRHHPYRLQKKNFDGKQEHGNPPQPLSGEAIYFKLKEMIFSCGKKCDKNNNEGGNDYWKRRSDFFELPYWKNLHVRHCLDVMHIEKNVCMNIVGTLLNIPGKSKDAMNSRLDLVEMNIRPKLAPMVTGNRTYIPATCYTLSREEKYRFCKILSEIKVLEGYSSNIRSLVSLDDLKLNGLKSHDSHVLMQQLLPIAIRSILLKNVRYTISRLCFFFDAICAKSFFVSELDALQEDIVMSLCNLEKYFLSSFFTIMVHLVVHLVREVKLCGPVYLRWMYPFERYMKVLKNFVRNRNRPEGCIAEAQVCEEAVQFCSDFLSGLDPIGLGSLNSKEDKQNDRPMLAGTYVHPDMQQLKQAHLHILQNIEEVSSAKDKNPVIGDMSFYGIIEDIWKVSYNTFNTVLFKCKWVDNKTDVQTYDLHFTLVDLSRIRHSSNSFIITTHGKQVFYVSDPVDPRWSVVSQNRMQQVTLMKVGIHALDLTVKAYELPLDFHRTKPVGDTNPTVMKQTYFILTTTYVLPFLGDVEKLKFPPNEYSFIDEQHWTEFVASQLKEDFKKKSENRKEKQKKHKYNHRTSKEGVRKSYGGVVWKQARMDHKGQIPDEEMKEVDELVATKNTTNAFSEEDILTRALGGKDRPGILRGVGKYVTKKKYFHTATQQKTNENKDEKTTSKEHDRMAKRIKDLEEELLKMKENDDCAGDLKEESGMGSKEKSSMEGAENVNDLEDLSNDLESEKDVEDVVELNEDIKVNIAKDDEELEDVEGDNVKMAVDIVVDGDCAIPIPSEQEMYKMSQEVGSHILWPRDLVITNNIKMDYGEFIQDMSTFAPTPIQNAAVALRFLLRMVENMGSFNIMNKKKPNWRVVKCPKQSGVVECGYYVMWFMRDIIISMSTSIIQICVVDKKVLLKCVVGVEVCIVVVDKKVLLKCVVDHKVLLKCVVHHEVLLKCVVHHEVLLKCCVVDLEVSKYMLYVVDPEVLLKCVVDKIVLLKCVVHHEVLLILKCCVVDVEVCM